MLKVFIFFLLILPGQVILGQSHKNDILGLWHTQIKDAKIRIYIKNDKYYGKVVWLAEPSDAEGKVIKDEKNPDKALRSSPIMGMDIITKMTYKDGEWTGGEIYDPKTGDTYTCKLWIEDGNLKVRGYLGWFYDTKTWTKAN